MYIKIYSNFCHEKTVYIVGDIKSTIASHVCDQVREKIENIGENPSHVYV